MRYLPIFIEFSIPSCEFMIRVCLFVQCGIGHHFSISWNVKKKWLGTGTSIKSGKVKLVLRAKPSHLNGMFGYANFSTCEYNANSYIYLVSRFMVNNVDIYIVFLSLKCVFYIFKQLRRFLFVVKYYIFQVFISLTSFKWHLLIQYIKIIQIFFILQMLKCTYMY